jgi:predicted neuraminidase
MNRQTTISTKGTRAWQGIPAIERAANGRLWCAFYSGGPREPDPDNLILLTSSEDEGRTWSTPEPIVDPPGPARAYDPALWHDPVGRLWLFYNLASVEDRDYSLWAITAEDSDAAEPHWGPPRKIEIPAPFAFRLNKPTVLSSGEWLLPVTWAPTAPATWFARGEQLQGVAISTDQGATWTLRGAVKAPSWALENMVVERRDGSLWMLIRTGAGVLWQSVSHDRGATWSTGWPTAIVNPGSRFYIRRLASGRLLLINTPHAEERRGLYAYVSDAEDETAFHRCIELDGRDRVSYPDAVEGPEGRIYAVHDHDRGGVGEIILSRFSEEMLLENEGTHIHC